jgi:hypothetical protein
MGVSTGTHPADRYIDEYTTAYHNVYGQSPKVYYIGNQWYHVNGEMIHHTMIVSEITRLRELASIQQRYARQQSMLSRLIKKLRSM